MAKTKTVAPAVTGPLIVMLRPGVTSPLRRSVRDEKGEVLRTIEFQPGVVVELDDPADVAAVQRDIQHCGIVPVTTDEHGRPRVAYTTKVADPKVVTELEAARAEVEQLKKDVTELDAENDELEKSLVQTEAHVSLLLEQLKEAGIEAKPAPEDLTAAADVAAAATSTPKAKTKPKGK